LDRDLFHGSYVQTYLQRDVRALANVGDEMAFMKFLRAAAARTGQILNLADMARDVDIAPNTAKNWLSILKASGIIYLLEPYHSNLSKRLVKAAKLYFLDTGLAAYLTEWSSPETLEAGAMSGPILETWAIAEVIRSYWHAGRQAPIYYYRDKDKKEIDLLIVRDGTIYPIEIKKTTTPAKRDIRHFLVLDKLGTPRGPGAVLCLTESPMPITETVWAVPVSEI
jgi:predicted AAA+ superfamily ATPase